MTGAPLGAPRNGGNRLCRERPKNLLAPRSGQSPKGGRVGGPREA